MAGLAAIRRGDSTAKAILPFRNNEMRKFVTQKDRKRAKAVFELARRAADVAARSTLPGLDRASAVMIGAVNVALAAQMSPGDIATWLRELADELQTEEATRVA